MVMEEYGNRGTYSARDRECDERPERERAQWNGRDGTRRERRKVGRFTIALGKADVSFAPAASAAAVAAAGARSAGGIRFGNFGWEKFPGIVVITDQGTRGSPRERRQGGGTS